MGFSEILAELLTSPFSPDPHGILGDTLIVNISQAIEDESLIVQEWILTYLVPKASEISSKHFQEKLPTLIHP